MMALFHNLMLAAAETDLPTAVSGVSFLMSVAFWVRWEHRMTKVETKIEGLEGKMK